MGAQLRVYKQKISSAQTTRRSRRRWNSSRLRAFRRRWHASKRPHLRACRDEGRVGRRDALERGSSADPRVREDHPLRGRDLLLGPRSQPEPSTRRSSVRVSRSQSSCASRARSRSSTSSVARPSDTSSSDASPPLRSGPATRTPRRSTPRRRSPRRCSNPSPAGDRMAASMRSTSCTTVSSA